MQETNKQTELQQQPVAEPRPWVTPDFKRVTLNEAMNSYTFTNPSYLDTVTYYS
jgi:hypothetical protein